MTCKEINELMPDLVLGGTPASSEVSAHLHTCAGCAVKLEEIRKTMALLNEWQAPEPSPYFDTRLAARLREEKTKAPSGWFAWVRRPAMALVATVLLVAGIAVIGSRNRQVPPDNVSNVHASPGTAVGDLMQLDKNADLYSDFEVLDDLQVQQDVTANP